VPHRRLSIGDARGGSWAILLMEPTPRSLLPLREVISEPNHEIGRAPDVQEDLAGAARPRPSRIPCDTPFAPKAALSDRSRHHPALFRLPEIGARQAHAIPSLVFCGVARR